LEVYWLGYWLPRLTDVERRKLREDIVTLMREGIIETAPGRKYPLDEIGEAVAQAEQKGRRGKVFLVPGILLCLGDGITDLVAMGLPLHERRPSHAMRPASQTKPLLGTRFASR